MAIQCLTCFSCTLRAQPNSAPPEPGSGVPV
eukprot:CAMPEP_0171262296 /NCGR_PEP_ID=MMETSP0790-20130122/56475_1 /TAXON_ID=2925 /ORGANISM="Alexandrium catenella, Strain OF101" /LENGTH=30 /DNA_ID= /DNA_START= /DNA_END= /DNA_ORIENTATION=